MAISAKGRKRGRGRAGRNARGRASGVGIPRTIKGVVWFGALTKAFVKNRIPELQFNFTDTATLEAAQKEPRLYGNLVVRVSGFSAYFVHLDREVQKDIMRRRAHGSGNREWGMGIRD